MNTFGENVRLTIFGESHGTAIGMVLDGYPAGEEIDFDALKLEMARRAPGSSDLSSQRLEPDEPLFLSGLLNGHTTGAPICAIIKSMDVKSEHYKPEKPRPGHADFTGQIRFKGRSDFRGGGPFSGRLTAPMLLGGAICKQSLAKRNISVEAEIVRIGPAVGSGLTFEMRKEILDVRAIGDSVGGVVECVVEGLPAGIGGLFFGGLESRISAALFAIPGVKGVEFGAGFGIAEMRGSTANDPIRIDGDKIYTETNHAGGINGGISNGMPLVVRCAFRPAPSIGREQKTVDLLKQENINMRVAGRHDPCIVPRALPVVEGIVAFCLMDAICEDNRYINE